MQKREDFRLNIPCTSSYEVLIHDQNVDEEAQFEINFKSFFISMRAIPNAENNARKQKIGVKSP